MPGTNFYLSAYGLSPPQRPRLRRRQWLRVLRESAMLHATHTLNRRSPRMVKRRNSPYASHDRTARTRVPIDCTPCMVPPPQQPAPIEAHGQALPLSQGSLDGTLVL